MSTSGLEMDLDPVAEWGEIFDETWRLFRDYFYVDNMHGYDWQALGDAYRALLPHVAHRSDLNYVLTEMVSELNAGHTYISGGDFEIPDRPHGGAARRAIRTRRGRRPLPHRVHLPRPERGAEVPLALTEVGVDVGVGDYVLAIDGRELEGTDNPYRLLQHLDDSVTLTVNSKPEPRGRPRGHLRPRGFGEPRCSTSTGCSATWTGSTR